jgi:hypothetical protein
MRFVFILLLLVEIFEPFVTPKCGEVMEKYSMQWTTGQRVSQKLAN